MSLKELAEVYIVIDDYTPDAGSTIYGIYFTVELAEKRLKELEDPENEYGCNMNKNDSIRIDTDYVEGLFKHMILN